MSIKCAILNPRDSNVLIAIAEFDEIPRLGEHISIVQGEEEVSYVVENMLHRSLSASPFVQEIRTVLLVKKSFVI